MQSPIERSSARSVSFLTAGIVLIIGIYGLLSNYQSVVLNSVVESFHLVGGAQGIMSSFISIGRGRGISDRTAPAGQTEKNNRAAHRLGHPRLFLLPPRHGRAHWLRLIAASLLTGLGFGWVDANCNAVMVDLHHDKSAKYLGMLHGGFGVGGLIAPLLIGALLSVVNWHAVSFLMSLIIALAGFVFLALIAAARKGVPEPAKEQPLDVLRRQDISVQT